MSAANEEKSTTPGEATGGNTQGELLSAQEAASLRALFGDKPVETFDNFDGDDRQKWLLAGLAQSPDCKGGDDCINTEIAVQYVYLHPISIYDEKTGRYSDALRTVLITDDRIAYAFVSGGIAKGVMDMMRYNSKGPWNPPLKVKITRVKTTGARSTYSLGPA